MLNKIRSIKDNAFDNTTRSLQHQKELDDDLQEPKTALSPKDICLGMGEWSTIIIGDRCNINSCATDSPTEYLGLMCPSLRCVVHATDGSIKRMSKNSEFLPCIQTLRHFKLRGESTHLLNQDLEIMDVKPVHIIFSPTRMSYTLSTSAQSVNMLVPICHVVSSPDIEISLKKA